MSFSDLLAFEAALDDLPKPDKAAIEGARARQAILTKPAGSLGRLEEIAVFFASWQGQAIPEIDQGRAVVFAGNHGVTIHGVSAFPSEVTAQMVANFETGGAAINALAAAAGLELKVIALDLHRPTRDFTVSPAMSESECLDAVSAGAAMVEPGLDIVVLGEMGIGNSTAAAALAARSFGGSAAQWVGPGTGIDAAGIQRKTTVIDRALACHFDAARTPFETLRRVGGREIAAIAGAIVRARQLRIPVILDGFICCSAIAPLAASLPAITEHCLAGHCSAEPGHRLLLDHLRLDPILNLNMRLGEGSGAALAAGVVRTALRTHAEMATFEQAGVSAAG
jgi:nicotinate-nucleotide--dimethylbenzimidazole phosphoribosyltransferase